MREVEKLKKNRDERRARLAGKIAQRREVYTFMYKMLSNVCAMYIIHTCVQYVWWMGVRLS